MAATVQQKPVPRKDPRPRSHDGANTGSRLVNKRPDRHYVLVSPDAETLGEYRARGFKVEVAEEGGVRFGVQTTKFGETLEYKSQVLMSLSLEEKAELDQHGEEGDTGWALADRVENAILDKRQAIRDTMRGLHGRYVGMEHDVRSETI